MRGRRPKPFSFDTVRVFPPFFSPRCARVYSRVMSFYRGGSFSCCPLLVRTEPLPTTECCFPRLAFPSGAVPPFKTIRVLAVPARVSFFSNSKNASFDPVSTMNKRPGALSRIPAHCLPVSCLGPVPPKHVRRFSSFPTRTPRYAKHRPSQALPMSWFVVERDAALKRFP